MANVTLGGNGIGSDVPWAPACSRVIWRQRPLHGAWPERFGRRAGTLAFGAANCSVFAEDASVGGMGVWMALSLACAPLGVAVLAPQTVLEQAARCAPPNQGDAARPNDSASTLLPLWRAASAPPTASAGIGADRLEFWLPALGFEIAEWDAARLLAQGDHDGAAAAWARARRMAPDAAASRACSQWEQVARARAGQPLPPLALSDLSAVLSGSGWEEPLRALAESSSDPAQSAAAWRRLCLFASPEHALAAGRALASMPPAVSGAPVAERLAYGMEVLRRRGWAFAQSYLAPLQALPGSDAAPVRARESLLAEVALRRNDRADAIARLLHLAASAPTLERCAAYARLGAAFVHFEDFHGARHAYLTARHVATSPAQQLQYFLSAAIAAFFAGDYDDCIEEMAAYLNSSEARSQADTARWFAGLSAYLLYDDASARTHWTALVQGAPSPLAPQAEYWLGRLEERGGRAPQAMGWWRRAARHMPSYYGALARAQLRQAQPPARTDWTGANPFLKAEAALLALQQEHAQHDSAALAWGHPTGVRVATLWRAGVVSRAAAELERVPRAATASVADAALARAEACLLLGAPDRAARHAAQALALVSVAPLAPASLMRAYRLAFLQAYPAEVAAAAAASDVSPATIWGVMRQESGFAVQARSRSNALGLMQLLPKTAEAIGTALNEPQQAVARSERSDVNVRFGAWYLAELQSKYQGHLAVAVGAYNAGPQAMNRWLAQAENTDPELFLELVPKDETRRYIKQVLGNIDCYKRLGRTGALSRPEALPGVTQAGVSF